MNKIDKKHCICCESADFKKDDFGFNTCHDLDECKNRITAMYELQLYQSNLRMFQMNTETSMPEFFAQWCFYSVKINVLSSFCG